MPAEVYPEYTTLEYQVPRQRTVHPPAYVFVVDTCLAEDELTACRGALSQVSFFSSVSAFSCKVDCKRQHLASPEALQSSCQPTCSWWTPAWPPAEGHCH